MLYHPFATKQSEYDWVGIGEFPYKITYVGFKDSSISFGRAGDVVQDYIVVRIITLTKVCSAVGNYGHINRIEAISRKEDGFGRLCIVVKCSSQ